MTLSEIEVQLQCAGYSQKEIEGMCIILSSHPKYILGNKALVRYADIIIAGGVIIKDMTGYLKGERIDYSKVEA